MSIKTPLRQSSQSSSGRRQDNSRQITSEHIAEHLAAFHASGGTVEVLGTTQVLKRLEPAVTVAKKTA